LTFKWLVEQSGFSRSRLMTMPLGNTWSRWREVKADEYALRMSGNPQAFIRAMTRLANQNLADADPPAWVEFLLHSRPSISKRVAMAQSFNIDE
jgi:STE24 endopeptidase